MSQFNVHRNGERHMAQIPFVMVVQSAAFNQRHRRVVLNPLEIVSVSLEALGPRGDSLVTEGDAIVAALGELISRAWD